MSLVNTSSASTTTTPTLPINVTSQQENTFAGSFINFAEITFTKVPNFIIEAKQHLTGAEAKLIDVILRQTIGWHKDEDVISLSQFEEKAGLTRKTVISSLKSLMEKKLIQRRPMGKRYGNAIYAYSLRPQQSEPTKQPSQQKPQPAPEQKITKQAVIAGTPLNAQSQQKSQLSNKLKQHKKSHLSNNLNTTKNSKMLNNLKTQYFGNLSVLTP